MNTEELDISLFETGAIIADRYEVVSQLGKGGMGMVLRVIDRALDNEPTALKILYPHHVKDPILFARFRNEVLVARQLAHPNIVRIYDFGSAGRGYFYISMEFVQGYSLKDRIYSPRLEQLEFPEICRILYEIGQGLAYAHRKGVIHRDIKPDNILMTPGGDVRITDFGLARTVQIDKGFTQTGETVGTPCYMAPEQISGVKVDGRADIYSLGILAYEMATGSRPFEDDSWFALAQMHMKQPMPSFAKEFGYPQWFENFVRESGAKRPEERFQSADEWCETLLSHIEPEKRRRGTTLSPAVFSAGVVSSLRSDRKRKRLKSRLLMLSVLLVVGFTLSIGTLAAVRNVPPLQRAALVTLSTLGQLFGAEFTGLKKLCGLQIPVNVQSFSTALKAGDLQQVKLLFAAGLDVNSVGVSGQPVLAEAIEARQELIAKELLAQGAKSDIVLRNGESFLHLATAVEMTGIAQELIDRGADVNVRDAMGRTPLMQAALDGNLPMVQFLLAKNALVSVSDSTPEALPTTMYAIKGGSLPVLQELIQSAGKGALEAVDAKQQTPLMYAAMAEREDMVQFLIANGADRERRAASGRSLREFLSTRLRNRFVPESRTEVRASEAKTRLRIVGEPEVDLIAGRGAKLRALSVSVRNAGDDPASEISAVALFPDGTKVPLIGPNELEPNRVASYRANINPLSPMDLSSMAPPKIEVICKNCW